MPVAPPSETRGRREGGGEEGGRRYGEGGERVTEQGVGAGGESGAGLGRSYATRTYTLNRGVLWWIVSSHGV